MSNIITVSNVHGYIDENGTAWLNAEDVARGLGFVMVREDRVTTCGDKYEAVRWARLNQYLQEFGYPKTVNKDDFMPENIFYRLAMKAKNETAEKFQAKVADEILPTIRKHGFYATPQKTEELLNNPDLIIGLCQKLKAERAANEKLKAVVESQKEQIGELTPKADYCDKILQSKEALPITVIAKDYGMSAQKMNDTLHRLGIQYKLKGGTWIVYQKYANQGYTCTKTFPLECGKSATSTQWTQKGRRFLYVTLKRNGVIPLIEQANSDVDTNGQIFLIKEYDESATSNCRNELEGIVH